MPLPPLVPPAAELSAADIARYSRHLLLPEVGLTGQQRLKHARVLVIGAGGLGSPVLLYLAAAGVGTLGIIDGDVVEASNLQRQVIHTVAGIGQPKTESARAALLALNPELTVTLHDGRLEAGNALALLASYDLVIDGCDNFATRYLVNDACVLAGKPYVWGSIFRFEGQASVFWEQAPGDAGIHYRDLYPEPPPPELAPSCAEGGVLGVLCAAIGAIMATEAIKLITGIGESLLGRLLVYDALEMRQRCLPIRRDPKRQPITGLIDYPAFCGLGVASSPASASISPAQLQQWRQGGVPFRLIDLREPAERAIVQIAGAEAIPKDQLLNHPTLLDASGAVPIVLHCKSGQRSLAVLQALQAQGYRGLHHLDGGILAWIRDVEPGLPSY